MAFQMHAVSSYSNVKYDFKNIFVSAAVEQKLSLLPPSNSSKSRSSSASCCLSSFYF